MSVRRLADEPVQPKEFAFTKANAAWAKEAIKKYPEGRQHSAVIPLLMRAQDQDGWVTRPAVEYVAAMLDMPLIRVLEVATFYTQFMLAPVGTKAHVQVCGTTPCMLRGAGDIIEACKTRIHPEPLHTNEDGTLSWEEVECQGACVNAPMIMISRDTYEDLTPERFEEIMDAFEAGKGDTVTPGPQVDRIYSAPLSGLTTLTDESAVTKSGRDGKTKKDAKAKATDGPVEPSKAGKPKTHAPETDPSIKSPSKVKADQERETRKSASSPKHDKAAADHAAEEAEGKDKQTRQHSHDTKPRVNPTASLAETASSVRAKKPATRKAASERGNPTMALARTAKGHGKPDSAPAGGKRPSAVKKPAKPDDLKMISGVGQKIEGILNDIGIYTYKQVAGWTPEERAWVDDHLSFRGRIEREDWVRQADALARGGAEEYERVFGKKPR